MSAFSFLPGHRSDLFIMVDHASDRVPPEIDLGVPKEVMNTHIAVDIGARLVAEQLAVRTGADLLTAEVSRLVVDLNRPFEAAVPVESDGRAVPGNQNLSAAERARRQSFHDAYHERVGARLDIAFCQLILSLHSFTPAMKTGEAARPWDCGVLYDRDNRAPEIAIPWLRAQGLTVGDNEPYSGASHGYTMQRHAEPRNLPYLFFEIRQDHLETADGREHWAALLDKLVEHMVEALP
ncbi:hypothetical protein B5C34_12035 [Pacificimonas flava]|uniref:N-formylglutamate amidohydrolase n=2 Tax=Pacificimonas TaxID=1960290 RepID=A0A219B8N7_9SPHN|nr:MULTISPECIES: N-formylglutamate amidohydrolase [Pacificimonas]MBZ6378606.1 N-formylglutamate amidohydrolase [Pacificimonas aurantium]OWV34118.1 hypothetical protein B5C34_12035 [Pacificimonas flava]